MLANSFDESRRGLANAMIDVGSKGGPALGTLLGAFAVANFGWRPFYWVLGSVFLLWFFLWSKSIPASTAHAAPEPESTHAWMKSRAAFATFLGLFCFNYAFYFLLTWLPTYLVSQRNFSLNEMAFFGALPYGVSAAASFAAGVFADRRVSQGAASGPLRRRMAVIGLALAALTLFGATLDYKPAALAMLLIAFIGMGLFTANVWAITQTLAGPQRAGSWTGWQNACGNLGGVAAPIVTAWCIESRGGFPLAFGVSASMLFASAFLYGAILPNVEEVSIEG